MTKLEETEGRLSRLEKLENNLEEAMMINIKRIDNITELLDDLSDAAQNMAIIVANTRERLGKVEKAMSDYLGVE